MSRLRNSNREKFQRLTYLRNLQTAGEIFNKLENENISPVLIKGFAAAVNYPNPFQRAFSDIDLAVDPKNFDAASKIISENKYTVDLHKGLRHLDTAAWDDLFQNSQAVEAEGVKLRFLCPEDHLRVLCVHWLNDGGADRTRLWDIYFLLKSGKDIFDWNRFLSPVDERRRRWLISVISIAGEYLGFELEETGFDFEKSDLKLYELPQWVRSEVEKEWKNDTRLIPMERVLYDKKEFYKQIRKRIPPNALQAVIETNAAIGNSIKIAPRINNFVKRAGPSIRRILNIEKE